MKFPRYQLGFSVIEIVIAASIIVLVVTSAAASWQLNLRVSQNSLLQSQAALLTEEAGEILHLFRDENWTANIAPLTLNTPYQISWVTNKYKLATTQNIIQTKFVRTLTFSAINRDSNDNITNTGGTLDAKTKKVSISVFLVGATSTPIMQSEMLIHNVYKN